MEDHELVDAFERGTLAHEDFNHRTHVRLGWAYIRHFTLTDAIDRFSLKLKEWAQKNDAGGLYHETITWAYLLIISERQHDCQAKDFDSFIASNQDILANPSILSRYYSQETLMSDRARHSFVMPDKGIQHAA